MTTDDQGVLLVSLDDGVATITLNRPDRGNGLTTELKERLLDALGNVGDDPTVRAVVLTGSGRSFCVGQDLGEHAEALRSDASTAFETVKRHYNPIVALLAGMPKPVIAATTARASAPVSALRSLATCGSPPTRRSSQRPSRRSV